MNKNELKELAATLNGIAGGEAWEWRESALYGEWKNPLPSYTPIKLVANGLQIRLKPSWQLPQPPDGMQWHRDDWTEEMLPDGYRPLLLDEIECSEDEYRSSSLNGAWFKTPCAGSSTGVIHTRTKRPLPQPQVIQFKRIGDNEWREARNPDWKQQKVPLGPDDVPPGSVLKHRTEAGWIAVSGTTLRGVWHHPVKGCTFTYFESLKDCEWEIKHPTDAEWQPCYKLIDTP